MCSSCGPMPLSSRSWSCWWRRVSTSGQSQKRWSIHGVANQRKHAHNHTHTHTQHVAHSTQHTHTERGRDEGRQACIWFAHRTTHFVGYLFWSYAHLALASKIECGSNEKLREREKASERDHEKGIKGKRQKAKGCKRIGKCARIRRKPKHSAKQTNEWKRRRVRRRRRGARGTAKAQQDGQAWDWPKAADATVADADWDAAAAAKNRAPSSSSWAIVNLLMCSSILTIICFIGAV